MLPNELALAIPLRELFNDAEFLGTYVHAHQLYPLATPNQAMRYLCSLTMFSG